MKAVFTLQNRRVNVLLPTQISYLAGKQDLIILNNIIFQFESKKILTIYLDTKDMEFSKCFNNKILRERDEYFKLILLNITTVFVKNNFT